MSGDLIDTTEMYLRTVYELQEEAVPPLRARIAAPGAGVSTAVCVTPGAPSATPTCFD